MMLSRSVISYCGHKAAHTVVTLVESITISHPMLSSLRRYGPPRSPKKKQKNSNCPKWRGVGLDNLGPQPTCRTEVRRNCSIIGQWPIKGEYRWVEGTLRPHLLITTRLR